MPQPVHFSRRIDFQFTPESLLLRPQLAGHIAVISNQWNEIEARIGLLLAALADSEAETVISIFLAIKNDTVKRTTIDTVSGLKLSMADNERFQNVLEKIGKRYIDRNLMVHGLWGISPKYPDKLLWADVRESTMFHVEMMSASPEEVPAKMLAYQRKIKVYGERDFFEIKKRIAEAYDELREFSKPIIERSFGPTARVDPPILWPLPGSAATPDPNDC